jgi:hypothetical protein
MSGPTVPESPSGLPAATTANDNTAQSQETVERGSLADANEAPVINAAQQPVRAADLRKREQVANDNTILVIDNLQQPFAPLAGEGDLIRKLLGHRLRQILSGESQ